MWFIILGLLIGVIIGIYAPIEVPQEFARYTAIAIMGISDSVFGAIRADLQHQYKTNVFISGLIFNMALAVLITFIGDRLGIDLYLAVLIVFTFRIFANLAKIKAIAVEKYLTKRRGVGGDKTPVEKS